MKELIEMLTKLGFAYEEEWLTETNDVRCVKYGKEGIAVVIQTKA